MWGHNDHKEMKTLFTKCHYNVIKMQSYIKDQNGDLRHLILKNHNFVTIMWEHNYYKKTDTLVTKCFYFVTQMQSYWKEPKGDWFH